MFLKTLCRTWIYYRFSITKVSIFLKPHEHEKGWSSVMKIIFSKFARNFAFTTDDFLYWFNWTESKITKYHDVDDLHDCEKLDSLKMGRSIENKHGDRVMWPWKCCYATFLHIFCVWENCQEKRPSFVMSISWYNSNSIYRAKW